jgi:hypothetical protein
VEWLEQSGVGLGAEPVEAVLSRAGCLSQACEASCWLANNVVLSVQAHTVQACRRGQLGVIEHV